MNVTRVVPNTTAVKSLAINPASSGSNTLLAAPSASGRIRVLALALVSTAANTVTFLTNAAAISGAYDFAALSGMVLNFNEHGWFETLPGQALNVSLSAASKVAMTVVYQVLPDTGA